MDEGAEVRENKEILYSILLRQELCQRKREMEEEEDETEAPPAKVLKSVVVAHSETLDLVEEKRKVEEERLANEKTSEVQRNYDLMLESLERFKEDPHKYPYQRVRDRMEHLMSVFRTSSDPKKHIPPPTGVEIVADQVRENKDILYSIFLRQVFLDRDLPEYIKQAVGMTDIASAKKHVSTLFSIYSELAVTWEAALEKMSNKEFALREFAQFATEEDLILALAFEHNTWMLDRRLDYLRIIIPAKMAEFKSRIQRNKLPFWFEQELKKSRSSRTRGKYTIVAQYD